MCLFIPSCLCGLSRPVKLLPCRLGPRGPSLHGNSFTGLWISLLVVIVLSGCSSQTEQMEGASSKASDAADLLSASAAATGTPTAQPTFTATSLPSPTATRLPTLTATATHTPLPTVMQQPLNPPTAILTATAIYTQTPTPATQLVLTPTRSVRILRPTATPAMPSAKRNPNGFTCVGGCTEPPDPSCAIKGNVNAKGDHIYHVPGGKNYALTLIKPAEGDRWFCTEQEARDAGFRAARSR